jgi:hypothetical protein
LLGIAAHNASSKIIGHRRAKPIRQAAPGIAPPVRSIARFSTASPRMPAWRSRGVPAAVQPPELVVGELRDDVPEISALARSGRPSQVVAESWSMTMKTMLLLSTLAGLVAATPSFAQSASDASNYSPAFGFPSYAPSGARSPNVNAPVSFGAWESGYALDGAGQVRTRNRQ